ncbi:GNAT family N-acetyltransferase [Clostridia bacterium OttesenSCG-928-F22]|nr:GNAT family N-acetyltransferase [Clostridia bacterium OttesenSCG-928-F22]
MVIRRADKEDLHNILSLQYLAYQSEARLLNNPDIPPLKQTLDEVAAEFDNGIILKALTEENTIIGSVRAYSKDGTLYIGKLIVHPDFQGQGIGTKLLCEIEQICPHKRYELFTSSKSSRNILLYERLGYHIFNEETVSQALTLLYLEKTVCSTIGE